jgi:copper transport protein
MRSESAWIIVLGDPSGRPFEARGLTLTLSNPQAGIEPLRRETQRVGDGRWQVDMGFLPSSGIGRWRVGVEILVDDFEQVTLEGPLPP